MGIMIKKPPPVPPLSFQAPSPPALPLSGSVTQSSYHFMASGAPSIG